LAFFFEDLRRPWNHGVVPGVTRSLPKAGAWHRGKTLPSCLALTPRPSMSGPIHLPLVPLPSGKAQVLREFARLIAWVRRAGSPVLFAVGVPKRSTRGRDMVINPTTLRRPVPNLRKSSASRGFGTWTFVNHGCFFSCVSGDVGGSWLRCWCTPTDWKEGPALVMLAGWSGSLVVRLWIIDIAYTTNRPRRCRLSGFFGGVPAAAGRRWSFPRTLQGNLFALVSAVAFRCGGL